MERAMMVKKRVRELEKKMRREKTQRGAKKTGQQERVAKAPIPCESQCPKRLPREGGGGNVKKKKTTWSERSEGSLNGAGGKRTGEDWGPLAMTPHKPI